MSEGALLGCPPTPGHDSDAADALVNEILRGATSKLPQSVRKYLRRLTANHPLVQNPGEPFRRSRCIVCDDTLRAGEVVLLCPCVVRMQGAMAGCQVAVHHDPLHGLYCYGDWGRHQHKLRCPATLRKIDG